MNAFLSRVLDGLLVVFQNRSLLVSLAAVALLTALAVLMVVRRTSDQVRLAAVKRLIHACLFEIRLFNDDIRAILRAQVELLGHVLTYLRLSLVPVLWMTVPLALFLGQLHFYFGYDGLSPGQQTLIKVRLRHPVADTPVLEAPPGVRIETPAVSIPSLGEVVWRVSAERPGAYVLYVHLGAERFSKSVLVSGAIVRRSPVRLEGGLMNQLRYPSEPPLAAGGALQSIEVTYPQRAVRVFGREVHWMVVFFGLSMGFALLLRKPLNVVL